VIPLTMSADGFMTVAAGSIGAMLEVARFRAASRLIGSFPAGVDGARTPA
jgi:hypothetical protein